jgi:hypothetical protein
MTMKFGVAAERTPVKARKRNKVRDNFMRREENLTEFTKCTEFCKSPD